MVYVVFTCRYLGRYEEELEQIEIIRNIGNRKNSQHRSREDVIEITKQRESQEFLTQGLGITVI